LTEFYFSLKSGAPLKEWHFQLLNAIHGDAKPEHGDDGSVPGDLFDLAFREIPPDTEIGSLLGQTS